jgi:tetratricopeptide (TPR) repeat protein/MFS family permease
MKLILPPRIAAAFAVFMSSLCVMILEIAAGRMIAPFLGSSLYTWTSVIGVVLAGIAAGNWTGGILADRFPPLPSMALTSAVSSAAVVLVLILDRLVGNWPLLWSLHSGFHIFLHVFFVFFLPPFFLGMISPMASRLSLEGTEQKGRVLGRLFAAGTLGSILGTFATGYLLIPSFGTRTTVWIVAGILTLTALVLGSSWWKIRGWTLVFVFLLLSGESGWSFFQKTGSAMVIRRPVESNLVYSDESAYSSIKVLRSATDPTGLIMKLNMLNHSVVWPKDPLRLGYGYNRIIAALTLRQAAGRKDFSTLGIGGGAFVLPRYLSTVLPSARIEIVEVDPEVTKAARKACGLPENSRIKIHTADGRSYVNRLVRSGAGSRSRFDVIHLDAFDDFTVPIELTTVEFARNVRSLLKDDGIYILNIVDLLKGGRLLSAMRDTLLQVFPFVYVLDEEEYFKQADHHAGHRTYVLVCSGRPIDLKGLRMAGTDGGQTAIVEVPPEMIANEQDHPRTIILSDTYDPMETLLAPVVRQGNDARAAQILYQYASYYLRKMDNPKAKDLLEKALALNPGLSEAHSKLGLLYARQGELLAAESHFREAVQLSPKDAVLRMNFANSLAQQGKTDEALKEYTEALRIEPDNSGLYINLAMFYYQQGDIRKTRELLARAHALAPDDPDILRWSQTLGNPR